MLKTLLAQNIFVSDTYKASFDIQPFSWFFGRVRELAVFLKIVSHQPKTQSYLEDYSRVNFNVLLEGKCEIKS